MIAAVIVVILSALSSTSWSAPVAAVISNTTNSHATGALQSLYVLVIAMSSQRLAHLYDYSISSFFREAKQIALMVWVDI